MEEKKRIKYLVADTTAFINAVPLNDYAENVLTVPDVIKEVRNKRQIRRLCVLPFDLQVREPRFDSVRYCVDFAKKTGDYASLSGIDIKIIALTYELEADEVGTEHLRKEPITPQIIASKEKPEVFQENTKMPGWYDPDDDDVDSDEESDIKNATKGDDSSEQFEETDEMKNNKVSCGSELDNVKDSIEKILSQDIGKGVDEQNETIKLCNEPDYSENELKELFEQLKCDQNETVDCKLLVKESVNYDGTVDDDAEEVHESSGRNDNEDDVGGDWITPSNIGKVKKALEGQVSNDIVPVVACMSTDFALQNVLKQINLQIAALDGRVIKNLRTYILRCYACFNTTSVMTKIFCPKCGNKTLKRVAVSLDENGKQVIHINTSRPLTSKFKNQSLPRFKGGKHSHNPILFEDQPIPRQMPSRVAKTKTNAMEADYVAGFSPFALRDLDSKSAMLRSKGHLKEWARNNTFEEDRRKRFYNRLYK